MKTVLYKGSVIKVFDKEFEIWRNGVLIARFGYNKKYPLMKCIKDAMEM